MVRKGRARGRSSGRHVQRNNGTGTQVSGCVERRVVRGRVSNGMRGRALWSAAINRVVRMNIVCNVLLGLARGRSSGGRVQRNNGTGTQGRVLWSAAINRVVRMNIVCNVLRGRYRDSVRPIFNARHNNVTGRYRDSVRPIFNARHNNVTGIAILETADDFEQSGIGTLEVAGILPASGTTSNVAGSLMASVISIPEVTDALAPSDASCEGEEVYVHYAGEIMKANETVLSALPYLSKY